MEFEIVLDESDPHFIELVAEYYKETDEYYELYGTDAMIYIKLPEVVNTVNPVIKDLRVEGKGYAKYAYTIKVFAREGYDEFLTDVCHGSECLRRGLTLSPKHEYYKLGIYPETHIYRIYKRCKVSFEPLDVNYLFAVGMGVATGLASAVGTYSISKYLRGEL